ncbi:site-specific DNA-methyltransferase [Paenibacillus graminis]|uniref:DNA-methyltransferase n=1 Tax=Paenibacillus graminis TaxID=189425 RepID=UPI002DB74759|nr:site-specific DNA-methyltransferase [Paenibacillus graminis]MEC0167388.1 site-specific DNA-methyltransferase [Paenibacillus graminis]
MIYNMNCIQGAQQIEDETAALIIADPPYNLKYGGTNQNRQRKHRFNIMKNDDLPLADYRRFSLAWLKQAHRILKPGHHIYVCIDWRMYPDIVRWLRLTGFVVKNCIVWDKENFGLGWNYRYQHEFIIMAVKEAKKNRRIRSRNQSDIMRIPRIPGNHMVHPTEKPVDLMKRLIENSSEEGEYIVDFFAGSGVVPAAAEALNRKWDAFEIDPHWVEVTMNRLRNLINPK